jgi:hypothetical protein
MQMEERDGIIRKSDDPEDGSEVYVIEYPDGTHEKIVKLGVAGEANVGRREVKGG